MVLTRGREKLVLYAILLAILFFALVRILISGGGNFFQLELLILSVLLLLTFIGLAGYARAWGERLLFFVFLLYLANLVLVWYFRESLYIVLLVLALAGLLLSLPRRSPPPARKDEELHNEVFETPPETTAQEKRVTTRYTPSKYVASQYSNVYHEPRCDWAKKIQKGRMVWFLDKKEALGKGFRKHSCVS